MQVEVVAPLEPGTAHGESYIYSVKWSSGDRPPNSRQQRSRRSGDTSVHPVPSRRPAEPGVRRLLMARREAQSEWGKSMRAFPRERFSSEVRLTPETVAAYARAAGDTNPLHYDPDYAATTRYARLIASGTHTTALLLGATAEHYSTHGAMIGLEFWVRFVRPIYADETIRLEWLVVRVTPNAKLGGDIVELRGRIRGEDGRTALGARGRVLVTARL